MEPKPLICWQDSWYCGMIGESWVENLLYLFVIGEKIGHCPAIAVMLLHADCESLNPAQQQPALERRQDRACGFLQEGQLVCVFLFCADNNSTKAITVAIQKFRG